MERGRGTQLIGPSAPLSVHRLSVAGLTSSTGLVVPLAARVTPADCARMTSTSSKPVARLSSPGEIVATIPSLCGFEPRDSIVLLSLRGPHKRLGLTIRLDLPPAAAEEQAAAMLVERVAADGASAVAVVVFGSARRPGLVDAVTAACERRAVVVIEALQVDGGRWTSYACERSCCPAEGTPVPAPPSLVEAQRALDGRAVLGSREDLVRSLAPPALLQARACEQALDAAGLEWLRRREADGLEAARLADLAQARAALDLVAQGGLIDVATAALLAIALHDVATRDEVATWMLKRSDALLALTEQLVRLTVPPYDAPVCTLLAWICYARGDGSRVNVALDRALATDPDYSLALLLRTALDGAVPPRSVRKILKATRRALRPA